jgi:hypothetical protein
VVNAFRNGLGLSGFVGGQNVTVEYRSAGITLINRVYGGCFDPTYVVVIVGNTNSALAAKAMTRTVDCFRQLTLGNCAASHRSRRRRNSS